MTSKFRFERWDSPDDRTMCGAHDGEWVRAEDAINREAVNADRIRVLEEQLKDCRQWKSYYGRQLDELKAKLKDLSV
jgi:hypothetical protein